MVFQILNCWKTKSNPCSHDKILTRIALKFIGSKFHDKYSAIGISEILCLQKARHLLFVEL